MRVTQEKALRKFWYCVMIKSELENGPQAFELLGEKIAIWLDEEGKPHAVKDRCIHRTAKLSKGSVKDGLIICPYHGWGYEGSGACVHVPQGLENKPNDFAVEAYYATERYGYVWIALEEPLFDIPEIPEYSDPAYRQIHEFAEDWACAPLRIMENAFDNAHLHFVHPTTIGVGDPTPPENDITETDDGFITKVDAKVGNPEHLRDATGIVEAETTRYTTNQFHLPFLRVHHIRYPNGLVNIHFTSATPVSEGRTHRIQFVLRNDTEEQVPAETVIAFDRAVSDEDQVIIETTESDVPLDRSEGVEFSIYTDKPGMLMRKHLRKVIKAHAQV